LSSAISARVEAPRTGTTTRRFGTRFIYIERSTVEIAAIQLSDRGLGCLWFCHFNEREAARLARVPVRDDTHALHAAVSGESRMKVVLRSLITEISDKYVGHSMYPSIGELSLSDCSKPVRWQAKVAAGKHSMGGTDAGKDNMSIPEIPKVLYEAFTFCNLLRSKSLNTGNERMLWRMPW
jgi:hypothetical protein